MAQRRMFSPDIVSTDAFLDMPVSSQVLYFHLGLRADDDGFVTPKMVMRLIGSSDDDLKVLISKRFILPFESGVVVIKHWLIHNLIRSDLYKETMYKKEKETLGLNEYGAYTELRDGVSELKKIEAPKWLKQRRGELRTASVPFTALRLGKDRLGKDSINTNTAIKIGTSKAVRVSEKKEIVENTQIPEVIKSFETVNKACKDFYGNKTQRKAVQKLLDTYGFDVVQRVVAALPKLNTVLYNKATTPLELWNKWAKIEAEATKLKDDKSKSKYAISNIY